MDGTESPSVVSEEASSLREKEQELLTYAQTKPESSTSMSSASASTHDPSRAKYQMKELETFAKRLEEVSNNSCCSKVSRSVHFRVQL